MKRHLVSLALLGAMVGCGSVTMTADGGSDGEGGAAGTASRGTGGRGGSGGADTGGSGGSAGTGGSAGSGGAGGSGGTGGQKDAAVDAPMSTDGGPMCGPARCQSGQVCCNALCGICTAPGQACVQGGCGPDAGTTGAACTNDSDCRLFDDYCMGCACRALGTSEPDPKCSGSTVACLRQPCMDKVAACVQGKCAVADKTAAKWYTTCGDPVCHGWTPKDRVPLCSTEKAGDPCQVPGERCDPKDNCNTTLICATADPRPGAGCPISRRDVKRDIHYLDPQELRRYHDELLDLKLATWRYKADPARERLGFIIDDNEQSKAVDGSRDMVDLYGYTSLAVATLQLQAREIAALQKEVAALRRKLRR